MCVKVKFEKEDKSFKVKLVCDDPKISQEYICDKEVNFHTLSRQFILKNPEFKGKSLEYFVGDKKVEESKSLEQNKIVTNGQEIIVKIK